MKLDPNEVKSINEEFKKPDLGEVTTSSQESVSNASSQNPATVTTTQPTNSNVGTSLSEDSVDSSNAEDILSDMMQQNAALNARLLASLDDVIKGNYAVKESIDRMYKFMFDEKYAPKPTIRQRDPFVPDSKSKEDRPGNGNPGEGALSGILGDLLGLGAAALAGKSAIGTIFGKKGAPTTTTPKSRGRIGGWVDKIRGKTPTTPTSTTVPQTAAKQGKVPAPSTVPQTQTPDSPNTRGTRTVPRGGGRLALLAGAGAAAYAGYDWFSSKITEANKTMDENRFITLEERQMQAARVSAGLPVLEGQDLIDYRTEVYGRNNILVNPKTGFPLSEQQAQVVKSGKGNSEYASTLTNDQAYELMSTGSVTAQVSESSILPSYADELAVTGAGIYVAKKASDALSPTAMPTTSPTTLGTPQQTTVTQSTRNTTSLLARAPMNDNVVRQKLPSDTQLKAIKQNLNNVSTNAAQVAEDAKAPKGVKLGRALPVLGTAMTVYDAANVITDDTLTTGQKAGELTDIAGGTAGAILGAKGGASAGAAVGAAIGAFFFGAGAVPGAAIGAAIGGIGGGIAGYMGGSAVTKSAREWLFSDDEEVGPVDSNGQPVVSSATPVTTANTTVSEQTENAFNSIVEASKPINNSWISNASVPQQPAKQYAVGVGVMRPGAVNNVAQPSVINQPTTASTNVFSQAATVTPSASISSIAPEPAQITRETYQPIKETYVVNNNKTESATTVAAKESKSRVENKGVGSSNTAVTRIDEISPIINDGGLGLLNTGVF